MPRAASASRGGWGAEWGGRPWFSSCGILFKPHHLPEPQFPNLLKRMLSKALTYKDEFPFPFREVCVLGPVESAVQANEHQGVSLLPQFTHHSFIHSFTQSLTHSSRLTPASGLCQKFREVSLSCCVSVSCRGPSTWGLTFCSFHLFLHRGSSLSICCAIKSKSVQLPWRSSG